MAKFYFRSDYSKYQSQPYENTVCIPLTRGMHALIDAEDFFRIASLRWNFHKKGYAVSKITKDSVPIFLKLHRIIANVTPQNVTDHINGDKLDNRKCNLRICSQAENTRNIKKRKDSKNRYKGVSSVGGHWKASISSNRKRIYLGYFYNEEDAARAYDFSALQLHGKFARTNFTY